MYADKVEVITDVISHINKQFTPQFTKDTAISEGNKSLEDRVDGVSDVLKSLEQFKTEVEALALQEAENYAKDVTPKIGDLGMQVEHEETYEEHERIAYLRP